MSTGRRDHGDAGDFLAACRTRLKAPRMVVDGRLVTLVGQTMQAEGCHVPVGTRCLVDTELGEPMEAEVIGFNGDRTLLLPAGAINAVSPHARVRPLARRLHIGVGEGLLGRVIDGQGQALDGKGPLHTSDAVPLQPPPINPLDRGTIDTPFDVGVRSINALLTLGRGQRVGLFAGSGVGKSSLLGMMTRHSEADVTIVAMVGERGREVMEFVSETLGDEGMKRAIVVAVPADQSPLLRLQGAMLATALAEYFRDGGRQVLLLVDSLTRFAQAQREIGLAAGEPPATRGYPPSVFSLLPMLVERAGAMRHGGAITAIYTVLAEGDDQNDPIVDAARAVLDGHIVLSRHLSDAAHFPAIDIAQSISRVRNRVTSRTQQEQVKTCLQLAASYRAQQDMLRAGLYQSGTDPVLDRAVRLWPDLQRFLQQDSDTGVDFASSMKSLERLLSVVTPASEKVNG